MDIMSQSACLVVIQNLVYSYNGFLFNYTMMDKASGSIIV